MAGITALAYRVFGHRAEGLLDWRQARPGRCAFEPLGSL